MHTLLAFGFFPIDTTFVDFLKGPLFSVEQLPRVFEKQNN